MKVIDLLDHAKAAAGATSDNQFAGVLGVSRQAVSTWRKGGAYPDEVTCAKLAELTGLSLAKVLGIVGEARAISKEAKAVWRKLATAAAVAALCVIPVGVKASEISRLAAATSDQCILCY